MATVPAGSPGYGAAAAMRPSETLNGIIEAIEDVGTSQASKSERLASDAR
jgi:hypothetical protein